MKDLIQYLSLIGACVMPLFNIPMILHIVKRKSSDDLSLTWLLGVWSCILLMTPSAFISPDFTFRIFAALNFFLFTAVVVVAIKYRTGK